MALRSHCGSDDHDHGRRHDQQRWGHGSHPPGSRTCAADYWSRYGPDHPPTTVAENTERPSLIITSPKDRAELHENTITLAGTSEPDARVFAGRYEADVDAEGNRHIIPILSQGKNVARVVARDTAGNESGVSVTVFYRAPSPTTTQSTTTITSEPTTTTTEKQLAEFSADQASQSCSEVPSYGVCYGTGQPRSLVGITSEYGSGEVEVGVEGQWEKKVFFEGGPDG